MVLSSTLIFLTLSQIRNQILFFRNSKTMFSALPHLQNNIFSPFAPPKPGFRRFGNTNTMFSMLPQHLKNVFSSSASVKPCFLPFRTSETRFLFLPQLRYQVFIPSAIVFSKENIYFSKVVHFTKKMISIPTLSRKRKFRLKVRAGQSARFCKISAFIDLNQQLTKSVFSNLAV